MVKRSRKKLILSPPQVLALGFIVLILVGSVLLSLPQAYAGEGRLSYLDALFTATSATCVTGLSVFNTGADLTVFGELVILVLVQIGGLGFMTMSTLIAFVLRRRISYQERLILQEAMNHHSAEGVVRLVRKVLLYALMIELTGAVLLTSRWSLEMPFGQAVYFGIFHSVSIFNNAGFDLFGSFSGRPGSFIHYVGDPFINVVAMILIFLGGIGFIVISDLLTYPRNRKLTLHSQVVLSASAVLIVVGTLVILVFEYTNPHTLQPLSPMGKTFGAMLQSVSSRSAGVTTLDLSSMRQATQFFVMILMFIGAAPGSSGGGIKVTTFVILIGATLAMVRGKEDIVLFERRIAKDRIYKAITFTLLSFILVVLSAMVLSITEEYSFLGVLFETVSAYATAGMSLGLTAQLTDAGKMFLILLMFVGRLGPVSLAYSLTPQQKKERFRYPEGKITIG
ncbi:TrkH family potassium uptake protein [Paenibacillus aurantius]|uniref:TrkH family potassium uptake protein n=1 Tax=Paenibacillus aurantius TaxID=2918900 RepID=A0AA96LFW1_9BACL|nr:TrkH family potassium uptake protein [Paenibacillus aurantius]WNQ11251.1 TrkH family potassium uptake protein [Paenibacillus aurantius]